MSTPRDPLAAFDDEVFEATVTAGDIEEVRLRELARIHQDDIRDLPGVDDLVYEMRNQFHQDPLLHRTEAVYVLAVQSHVWDEFGDSLETTADSLDALRDLHDRQARQLVDTTDRLDADDALVLTRT
jgi:hypothetical protein